MKIYLMLLFALLIVSFSMKQLNIPLRNIAYVGFLMIFLVAAFRDISVGKDTGAYARIFMQFRRVKWEEIYQYAKIYNVEIGYAFFNKIIGFFSTSANLFIALTDGFIYFSFARFVGKYSKNVILSLFIFVTWDFFFHSLNIMRQYFAIAILLFAIDYLIQNKKIYFIIAVMVGALFHESALIFFLVYFTRDFRKKIRYLAIAFMIAILFCNFPEHILTFFAQYGYSDYIYRISSEKGDRGGMLIASMLMILLFLALIKLQNIGKQEDVYFLLIFGIGVLFQLLALQFALAGRIMYYFNWTILVFVPNFLEELQGKNKRYIRYLGKCGFYILFLVYFLFFSIPADSTADGVIPYIFFFS